MYVPLKRIPASFLHPWGGGGGGGWDGGKVAVQPSARAGESGDKNMVIKR